MKTENKVLKFNEFINENKLDESKPKKHWDTSILDDNDIELGDMISSVKEFRTQMDYCLLDLGDGAWRGGYRYKGKKNGNIYL